MYKKLFLFLSITAMLVLGLASCGSDEPDIPRDRDVTLSIKALSHVLNTTTNQAAIDDKCTNTMLVSQKNKTVDFDLHVIVNGSERTFAVKNVPLTAVEETSRFSFNQISTNTDVTNLQGTIDLYDQVAIFQYDIPGHHVCVTIPEVFFSQVSSALTYSDGSKSNYSPSFWTIKVNPTTMKANLSINDLEISKDLMIVTDENGNKSQKRTGRFFNAINGNGANVEPTATGFKVIAENLTTQATYNGAQGTSAAITTNDYPMRELVAEVNLTASTLQATYTLRHVLARDADKFPTEWDDINFTSTGIVYKKIIL